MAGTGDEKGQATRKAYDQSHSLSLGRSSFAGRHAVPGQPFDHFLTPFDTYHATRKATGSVPPPPPSASPRNSFAPFPHQDPQPPTPPNRSSPSPSPLPPPHQSPPSTPQSCLPPHPPILFPPLPPHQSPPSPSLLHRVTEPRSTHPQEAKRERDEQPRVSRTDERGESPCSHRWAARARGDSRRAVIGGLRAWGRTHGD